MAVIAVGQVSDAASDAHLQHTTSLQNVQCGNIHSIAPWRRRNVELAERLAYRTDQEY
jgi:hypothetical protein